MAKVAERKPGNRGKEHPVAVYTKLADRGVPITDNIVKMVNTLVELKKAFPDIEKTGNNIVFVASKDKFPDRRKAMKIGYAVLYLNNVLEKITDRVERKAEKRDVEELADYANASAFNDFLVVAWNGCIGGDDKAMKERYEILYEGLKDLAKRYRIKMKKYGEISKEDAKVDVNKVKPQIKEEVAVMEAPEKISKKDAAKMLAEFLKKGWDKELEKLLKIPKEVFVKKRKGYFIFYEKEDSKAIKMIRAFFGEPGAKKIDFDAGYCMMIQERGSHTYVSLLDTSRRIAVKSAVFSMHEKKGGWGEFKKALKDTLEAAGKIPKKEKKTFLVHDIGMRKKYDLSKLKTLSW